jgi:hypothetical protein
MKNWRLHLSVLLISLGTLVFELSLMRVFSVTIWNYYAFFVVSLALLGGSTSAALIFIRRGWFAERIERLLPWTAGLFAALCALAPALYLNLDLHVTFTALGLLKLLALVLIFFLPFLLGGFTIAAIYSFHSERIGSLYWADLLGGGLGCLLVIPLLNLVPAPNLLAWIGLLPATASLLLAKRPGVDSGRGGRVGLFALGLVLVLALSQFYAPEVYDIHYPKFYRVDRGEPIQTTWSHFSRLTVYESVFWVPEPDKPFGWGMSDTLGDETIDQYWIDQDDSAGTPITRFEGDPAELDFLPYDVTNLAYSLGDYDSALIVGGGGGRDILAAKHFGVDEVTAVEINPQMIELVEDTFADFAGRPYSLPGVTGVVSEARSYLTRDEERYDLLMISMIDSWAATMAGAFALSENNLYTVEAVDLYLDHLTEDGVLTMSRWYNSTLKYETYRLVNLLYEGLERQGYDNPAEHIAVVNGGSIATVLVGRQPFEAVELDRLTQYAETMDFTPLWLPGRFAADPELNQILSTEREAFLAEQNLDLSAPTDNRPFFFMFTDSVLGEVSEEAQEASFMPYSQVLLRWLFYILLALALVLIILPLALKKKEPGEDFTLGRVLFKQTRQWLYFAAIGLGFMLIELSLIQRYVLFLGHPSYATTVVIFALLLFAGLGSASTTRLAKRWTIRRVQLIALGCVILLGVFQALVVPSLLENALGAALGWRIALSILLLAPLGYVMGMSLPLGIKRLNAIDAAGMVPYVWGINGVFSVFASVVSIVIALSWGYTIGLFWALGAYLIALLCAAGNWRRKKREAATLTDNG